MLSGVKKTSVGACAVYSIKSCATDAAVSRIHKIRLSIIYNGVSMWGRKRRRGERKVSHFLLLEEWLPGTFPSQVILCQGEKFLSEL